MPIPSAYSEDTVRLLNGYLSPELNPGESREGEFKFFIGEAKKSRGPVLDLACCAGRMLMVLARAGIEVFGLDASLPALQLAQKAMKKLSKRQQKRIRLIQGDMRHFHFRRPFSLVIIPYHSFWYNLLLSVDGFRTAELSVESVKKDAEKCIKSIMESLKPRGKFIIDFPVNYTDPPFLMWWNSMVKKYKFKFKITDPYCSRGYQKVLVGRKLN